MAQHFLLSKAARTQSITEVARMSEREAYRAFCKARWPRGVPDHCPHCGVVGKPWRLKTRKRLYAIWKCRDKNCRKEFSVTSCTIFANRKLAFRDILAMLAMSSNGQKGKSALQLSLDLKVCWRTAWHNLMKVREVMARERDGLLLRGIVEMDGMYLNRHIRRPNVHADAPDGRLAQNRHPGNRCIIGMRERRLDGRTVTLVTYGEDRHVVAMAAQRFITPGSFLITDQHEAYAPLAAQFLHRVVDHGERYVEYRNRAIRMTWRTPGCGTKISTQTRFRTTPRTLSRGSGRVPGEARKASTTGSTPPT